LRVCSTISSSPATTFACLDEAAHHLRGHGRHQIRNRRDVAGLCQTDSLARGRSILGRLQIQGALLLAGNQDFALGTANRPVPAASAGVPRPLLARGRALAEQLINLPHAILHQGHAALHGLQTGLQGLLLALQILALHRIGMVRGTGHHVGCLHRTGRRRGHLLCTTRSTRAPCSVACPSGATCSTWPVIGARTTTWSMTTMPGEARSTVLLTVL
jgi:hypothetical protein